jgi:uncharacterized membrane protein YbhN (UPF0104 family)
LSNAQDVRKKGHGSLIARIVVATAAILWVFRGQDWGELAAVFRGLNPWYLGVSVAIFAAAQVVIAARWWLLLRAQGIHIGVLAAVRLFYLGLFYNNVMPGVVGGDLLKAWYVAKHTDKRLEGVLSVIVDRAVGLAGLLVMAVLTYGMFVRGRLAGLIGAEGRATPGWISQHRSVVLWAFAVVLAALVLVLAHPYGRMRLGGAARAVLRRGVALLRGVKEALVLYCRKPGTISWAFILTFISQSTVIVSFWLVGRDLEIKAGLRYYFVIFPVTWVVGALPISVAGLGVVEAVIVELFTRLTGTPRELGMALALCQRFIWVLASLPGGLIHLLGAHLPRDICVDSEPPGN